MAKLSRPTQVVLVALALALTASAASANQRQPRGNLYPGEEIITARGFPALTKFEKGSDPHKPLVVFIPGASHLGRIAHGCASCDARHFPAYWFRQRGFSFLAISYPLAHPVYDRAYPDFTVRDWGRQAAEITQTIIARHGLNSHVILIGWSMGGKIAQPYNEAAADLGIELDFFVALAATPPLPMFVPGIIAGIKRTPEGLADYGHRYAWFISSLEAQEALNGHEIMSRATYLKEILGPFPINLLGTELRFRAGEFVPDVREGELDMGSFKYAHFPLVTVINGTSALDARHVLTDESAWGMYTVQKIYQGYLVWNGVAPEKLGQREWQRLRRVVASLPRRLSRVEEGTHFLFVGPKGARALAADVEDLSREVRAVKDEIGTCIGKPVR